MTLFSRYTQNKPMSKFPFNSEVAFESYAHFIVQGDPKKSKPIFGRHFGILPEGNFKFSGNITKL